MSPQQIKGVLVGVMIGGVGAVGAVELGSHAARSFSVETVCVAMEEPPATRVCRCVALASAPGKRERHRCRCQTRPVDVFEDGRCVEEEIRLRFVGLQWRFDPRPKAFEVD